jgi:hypothetical protein
MKMKGFSAEIYLNWAALWHVFTTKSSKCDRRGDGPHCAGWDKGHPADFLHVSLLFLGFLIIYVPQALCPHVHVR